MAVGREHATNPLASFDGLNPTGQRGFKANLGPDLSRVVRRGDELGHRFRISR